MQTSKKAGEFNKTLHFVFFFGIRISRMDRAGWAGLDPGRRPRTGPGFNVVNASIQWEISKNSSGSIIYSKH